MSEARGRAARNPGLAAALFLAVGLAAAFLVSAIAGTGSGRGADLGGVDGGPIPGGPAAAGAQAALGGDAGTPRQAADVRVEVLNGSGVGGLARTATDRLRGHGFDVVFFGNAPRFDHARSMVLDRTGDTGAARVVAAALGIDSVASAPDSRLLLDVTVVLGSDWPPPLPERTTTLDRLRRLVAPLDSVR